MSQAQVSQLQKAIDPIVEALKYELEAVKAEAEWVAAPTLRVEPDLYKSMSIVGPYFTPQEARSLIMIDASELEKSARRVMSGSLAPYISGNQKTELDTVIAGAKALTTYMQQHDIAPLTGGNARLAEDHVEEHTSAVTKAIEEAERGVVSGEAGSIPVNEPSEGGLGGLGGLIAVGALVAVGVIIADLI